MCRKLSILAYKRYGNHRHEKNNRKLVPVQLVRFVYEIRKPLKQLQEIPTAHRQQLYWTEHFPKTEVFRRALEREGGSERSIS